MKLFKVTVEHTFFMVAEDESDASLVAPSAASEAIREDVIDFIVEEEVTSLDEIPQEWRKSCPWGESGSDMTCEEWLTAATVG